MLDLIRKQGKEKTQDEIESQLFVTQVLHKASNTLYTSTTPNLYETSNIPAGKYRVTWGANCTRGGNDGWVDVWLAKNNVQITSPSNQNLGLGNPGGVTDYSGNVSALSKTIILDEASPFKLHVYGVLGGTNPMLDSVYLTIERLDDNTQIITTEWD